MPVYIIQYGMPSPTYAYTQLGDNQKYYVYERNPKTIPYKHFYVLRMRTDTFFPAEDLPADYTLVNSKRIRSDGYYCEEYIKN